MIGKGATTAKMTATLDLSPRTIQSHRKNIKLKLQVRSSVELQGLAIQWWQDNDRGS